MSCLQLTVKVLTYRLAEKPDGFSVMEPDWGWCLAVNITNRPTEQILFTAAHELGHMVCGHLSSSVADGKPTAAIEQVADSFAGHFLVPSESLRAHWKGVNPSDRTLNHLHLRGLKAVYGVSYHCLLIRLLNEGFISGTTFGLWKSRLYPNDSADERDALTTIPVYEERLRILALQAYQLEYIGTHKVAEMLDMSFEEAWDYLREAASND